jgi:hypothetical protein
MTVHLMSFVAPCVLITITAQLPAEAHDTERTCASPVAFSVPKPGTSVAGPQIAGRPGPPDGTRAKPVC